MARRSTQKYRPPCLNFFHEKIEKLQPLFTESIDSSRSPSPTVQQLQNLQPATIDEIRTLINKSPSKSCPLDPIPTFLLKDCLEELLPAITTIINASLNTASVPISFKKAVVTPLLKKMVTRSRRTRKLPPRLKSQLHLKDPGKSNS